MSYLLSKLERTSSDETVTDILRVFLRMKTEELYFVTHDDAAVCRIEARVQNLNDGAERRASEEIPAKLRSEK